MDQPEEAGTDPFPILLNVLRSGKGHLAWAKYAEEPWWPALSLTGAAWDTLRTFCKCADDEPTGSVEKGKSLVFFLGETTYEVVERGHVTKHFWDRKPHPKEMSSNDRYRVAVEQSQRLMDALEAREKPDIEKLREAVRSGEATLVWAKTENIWWPALRFFSLQSAQATGAEISLDPSKLQREGYNLVYRLGGLPNCWQSVRYLVPYAEKRIHKDTSNTLEKAFCISPGSDRAHLHETAVTEAESLLTYIEEGEGRGEGSTKRGAEDDDDENGCNGHAGDATPVAGKKRARTNKQHQEGGGVEEGKARAMQYIKYGSRERRRKKLTPEEVRKIRRLAEGLMYMAAVQETPALMDDLIELRESLSQTRRGKMERAMLDRLEVGLATYAKKMRQQKADGERAFRRFKTQAEEAAVDFQATCVGMHKDVAKALALLNEHRSRMSQQMRSWTGKKGFTPLVQQEGHMLQEIVEAVTKLEQVQSSVDEPKSAKHRVSSALLDNAEVAFKIGDELTQDQIQAAEQLYRTCGDFKARLDKDPTEAFF